MTAYVHSRGIGTCQSTMGDIEYLARVTRWGIGHYGCIVVTVRRSKTVQLRGKLTVHGSKGSWVAEGAR
jgi:hypothetical protein